MLLNNYIMDATESETSFSAGCSECFEELDSSLFCFQCIQCGDRTLCGRCAADGKHPEHTLIRLSGSLVSITSFTTFNPTFFNYSHNFTVEPMVRNASICRGEFARDLKR